MNFPISTGHYDYRPLKARVEGWDVYGVQKGLIARHYALSYGADGIMSIGGETQSSVKLFQKRNGLTVDGIAGIATQRQLCVNLARVVTDAFGLPVNLLYGFLEKESGFQIGNYTTPYDNGTRDFGACQINTPPDESELRMAFDPDFSLRLLADSVVRHYRTYWNGGQNPHVTTKERAWKLAAGSWNRPAWTDTLAKGGILSQSQLEWVNGYIDRVTAYVVDWTP